jgi:Inhibitor of vertebrate lysozyme (Ivy)
MKKQKFNQGVVMKFIKMLAIYFALCTGGYSQTNNDSNFYIWDAMKNSEFNNSYKEIFKSYTNLFWVRTPRLGSPMMTKKIDTVDNFQIYTACKPHNCGEEHLIFIYHPDSKKGWGRIFINSEPLIGSKNIAVENYLSEFKGK